LSAGCGCVCLAPTLVLPCSCPLYHTCDPGLASVVLPCPWHASLPPASSAAEQVWRTHASAGAACCGAEEWVQDAWRMPEVLGHEEAKRQSAREAWRARTHGIEIEERELRL